MLGVRTCMLDVGTCSWVSGLVFGCLDLYLGVWTCVLGYTVRCLCISKIQQVYIHMEAIGCNKYIRCMLNTTRCNKYATSILNACLKRSIRFNSINLYYA